MLIKSAFSLGIFAQINANFSADTEKVCSGWSVVFTDATTGIEGTPEYNWDFGSNASPRTATGPGPHVIDYEGSGKSTVTLTVSDGISSDEETKTEFITVDPLLSVSVSISASPSGAICTGAPVIFTASPVNGGTPTYQWYKGVTPIDGETGSSYTSSTLADGNEIYVIMTSSESCSTGSPATSNKISTEVNPFLPVSVSISASPSDATCAGTPVIFTATPVNGGTPSYQWFKGSTPLSGETGDTYTSSALANGDEIYVIMTSSVPCVTGNPATSNKITVAVNPLLPASVSISASPPGVICAGASVTFTATPANGGTPSFQWYIGANPVTGETGITFTNSALSNGDEISVIMTSTESCSTGNPATSSKITMTVNPLLPASVSISASPSGAICAGTSVTFTATPVNGGTPSYQWYKGATSIDGETGSSYTSSTLADGNEIYVIMISGETCATGSPATSNRITMAVNPLLPSSVSISASPSGAICAGTPVIFTATAVNGGTPSYQWYKGSTLLSGETGESYTSVTPANGDEIYVIMTSGEQCATGTPATSNRITMEVNPILPAGVSISASPPGAICAGTSVTFSATPVNGGTPSYQWYKGATPLVAETGGNYTTSTLSNGDEIYVIMTSSSSCISGSPATSNKITKVVNPLLPASVTISSSSPGAICAGTSVIFTATPVNGGTPSYQWYKRAAPVAGETGSTYTTSTLANGDEIYVIMISGEQCATGSPATSNKITMTVNPLLPASVSISASPSGATCAGTPVTFTASPVNGGTPSYQWYKGVTQLAGETGSTYTSASLANGDAVSVRMTSTATCATGSPATSQTIINIVNPLPVIIITGLPACSADLLSYSMSVTVGSGAVTSTSGTVTNTGLNTWSVTGVPAGTNISVKVTDPNTCERIINVSAPNCACTPIQSPVSGGDKSYCEGSALPIINASVQGGETVDWFSSSLGGSALISNSLTYSPSAPGTYYAGARNPVSNCVSSTRTEIIVLANPLPVPALTSSDADNHFCNGTSVTFTAEGGTSYIFRSGGVDLQSGSSNTFTTSTLSNGSIINVLVTDSKGCSALSGGIVNSVVQIPAANPGVGGDECDLDFQLNAVSGIGTGTWSQVSGPGTASFNPGVNSPDAKVTVSEYGNYIFKWTEVNGICSSSNNISVNFYRQPVANAGTGGDNCGREYNLNGSLNAGTGIWTRLSGPGDAVFSDNTAPDARVTVSSFGEYTLRWTVTNGVCSTNSYVTINFVSQPAADGGNGGQECDRDFLLNAITGQTGTWSKLSGPGNVVFSSPGQSSSNVTVDAPGVYDFLWTIQNSSCQSSDIVRVTFHDIPVVSAGTDVIICEDGSVQLSASGEGVFKWSPESSLSNVNIADPVAAPDITTTYKVILTDLYGCQNTDEIKVTVRSKPVADAGPDQVLHYIFNTNLEAGSLDAEHETGGWLLVSGTGNISEPDHESTAVTGLSTGVNTFQWKVDNGVCTEAVDLISVTVEDLMIPSLITPDHGDQFNEYFVIRGIETLGKTSIVIFDKRGLKVFENNDYRNDWNGVDHNNKDLPEDTYFYVIKPSSGNVIKGFVVIKR